jgi:hypothetical protein
MKCAKCETEMIEGVIGKESPLHLRFVPKDKPAVVSDYAGVTANGCPKCGYVELSVDAERLRSTTRT